MKFITYLYNNKEGFGVLSGEDIIDLSAQFTSLHETLRRGQLKAATAAAASSVPHVKLGDVTLLPPITTAEKYFCIGVNYANRNAEYKDGSEAPKNPSVFMRSRESSNAPRSPITLTMRAKSS